MKVLIFLLLIFSSISYSLDIKSVNVECSNDSSCEKSSKNLKELKGTYKSRASFNLTLEKVLTLSGAKLLSLESIQKRLKLKVHQKRIIKRVIIRLNGKVYSQKINIPIEVGDFFDEKKVEESKKLIKEHIKDLGWQAVSLSHRIKSSNDNTILLLNIVASDALVVEEVTVKTRDKYIEGKVNRMLSYLVGSKYNQQVVSDEIDTLRVKLTEEGYYFLNINFKRKEISKLRVSLVVTVTNVKRQAFSILGLSQKFKRKIKDELRVSAILYRKYLADNSIEQIVREVLFEDGIIDFKFNLKTKKTIDEHGSEHLFSIISVDKKPRVRVKKVSFVGNRFFSSNFLKNLYKENADEKTLNSIYSKKYYLDFLKILKREYAKNGFVESALDFPILTFNSSKTHVSLKFVIREGNKAQVTDLNLTGVQGEIKDELLSIIDFETDKSFNPIAFESMLKKSLVTLGEKGYYFATIENYNMPTLVKYYNQNTSVHIKINFNLGKRVTFNRAIVLGNEKTKDIVIRRHVKLKKGQVIKREDIRNLKSYLLGLGLFSKVDVDIQILDEGLSNIVVDVRERQFGQIELAPGVRSDLGPKISSVISYNNLGGMNRKLSLEGQVNRRFNLSEFARSRQGLGSFIEFDAKIGYSENNFLNTQVDFSSAYSQSRLRFFAFDANIRKISYTGRKVLNDWFSVSLTQQLEKITQFNASGNVDEGQFQIGSITPSLTFDFRNNRINTTSGSYFNLSVERASPTFLSQDTDELSIDYYKVTSRNFFYQPFKNGTLAMALTMGIQENLGDQRDSSGNSTSYIPNIKVFRLTGIDIVRGYEDEEINRLVNNNDISGELITGKAYMINLKIEPRFFVSDSFVAGAFFDAGRVFVDKIQLNKLRSSVGLTFKYVTPVGTLDFDYGIKILRKKNSDGILDSPGRLHVSIGFF